MKICIFSEVDPLYSEKNRIHWIVEHLSKKHDVVVLALRDTTKTTKKQTLPCDVVYLNSSSPHLTEAFPYQALSRSKEHICTSDLFLNYNGLRLGYRLMQLANKYGVASLYDIADNLPHIASASAHLPRSISRLTQAIAQWYVRSSAKICTMLTVTNMRLVRSLQLKPKQVSVVPNGFDWTIKAIKTQQRETRVLYLGALREWVNINQVIEEAKHWPSYMSLHIIGDEGLDQKEQSDHVTWYGHIPYADLPDKLTEFDVGIIPFFSTPTTDDALPLKLFEYFSQGLPVVSTPLPILVEEFSEYVSFVENTWQHAIETLKPVPPTSLLETYRWSSILEQLEQSLQRLV